MLVNKIAAKIYYGWVIVLAGLTITTITYGSRLSFGTLFGSLVDEFGWSRAVVTSVFSASLLFQAALQPVAGALLDKYGPRRMLGAGSILLCTAFLLFGRANSLLTVYIAYGLFFSLAILAMGMVINTTMVSYWFERKRGIASGAIVIGTSLGIFIFNPLLAFLISGYGWRTSVSIIGITAGLIILSTVILLIRDKPQDVRQNIDGRSNEEMAEIARLKEKIAGNLVISEGLTFKEAVRTKDFWLLMIVYIGDLFSWMAITNHFVIALTDSGVEQVTAAATFGYIGLLAVFSGIFCSWLSDRLRQRKYILAVGLILIGIGVMLFAQSSVNTNFAYVAVFIIGIGRGGVALIPSIVADRFGVTSMGKIWGTITTAGLLGGTLGPVFLGVFYDHYHSYMLAWQITAVLLFVAGFCTLMVGKKQSVGHKFKHAQS
ncbi:MAG: MFS transporter [Syntrophomonadaceae bacterium]|jgi:MFS family permease